MSHSCFSGQYEYNQVHPIIDEAPILHVAFQGSPDQDDFSFPVILPMIGCTGVFNEDNEEQNGRRSVYLHGYVSSRILRLSRNASESNGDGPSGIPVCVSATLMDGIVLALTPNHSSCNYRSAIVYGHAEVVTDEKERLWALELMTDNLVPDRWRHTRYPNKAELQSTGVLRVDIQSASAKVRAGTTGEAKEDLKNETMRKEVWAGVIPCRVAYGEPVPAPTNLVTAVPNYIEDWVSSWNQESEEYSIGAARG